MYIISAKEAKETSDANKRKIDVYKSNRELKRIQKKIDKAVMNGEYEIVVINCNEETISYLKECGYEVSVSGIATRFSNIYILYKISWE